jgi:hypothetical protein
MPMRPPAGFISAFYDPLKNPNAPTIGTATGGNTSASVAFTPPSNVGGSAISSYTAISTPGAVTASAASSPISVTGLTNGTAYTFAVWATNTYGPSAFSAASNSVTPAIPVYGIFAGGNTGSMVNVIQYVVIATTGNATDVGDLAVAQGRGANGTISSSTRGIMAAGSDNIIGYCNTIQYMTIATTGNSLDFGDCSGRKIILGGCSNATRGIIAGGDQSGAGRVNTIEYVTIATTGNTTDFGDLTQVWEGLGGVASTTRGVFACSSGLTYNTINYVTIASTGDAVDFGDLNSARTSGGACSNSTTGVFGGGYLLPDSVVTANVQSITIASTGNSSSFGTLTVARTDLNGVSNSTRALFAGGSSGGDINVIDYLTFSGGGSAADFGDLLAVNKQMFSISSGHGGL